MADIGTYDTDFYAWTREQAAALRDAVGTRTNLPIDWENVAEEIEDLGKSRRRELASRIGTIIEHLLKLQLSPAADPRNGWAETIVRSRTEITKVLTENPSLRPQVPELVEGETGDTARLVAKLLRLHGEATPDVLAQLAAARFTVDQVLGDWFPGEPPPGG